MVALLVELVEPEGDAVSGRVVVKFVVVVKVLSCLFVPSVTTVDTERDVMTVELAEELAEDYIKNGYNIKTWNRKHRHT